MMAQAFIPLPPFNMISIKLFRHLKLETVVAVMQHPCLLNVIWFKQLPLSLQRLKALALRTALHLRL